MLSGTLNCVNLSNLDQSSSPTSSSSPFNSSSLTFSSLSMMSTNYPSSPSSLSTSSSILSSSPYDPLESIWTKHIDDEVSNLALQACHQEVKRVSDKLRISPDPFTWTVDDVILWLSWQIEQLRLPMFPLNYFQMDGIRLCSLSESDFKERAQVCGDVLYAQLEIWKTLSEQEACKRSDMIVTSDYGSEGIQSDDELSQSGACEVSPSLMSPSSVSSSSSSLYLPFASSPSPISSPSPCLSPPSSSTSGNTTAVPSSSSSPSSSNRNTSGSHIHLWQFLKELLGQSQQFGSCIRWIDRNKGIFKIEDSVKVAKLWGRRKNRPAMNYDKLSRSIRQYYKKGIMKKTERSQRLVYQFCQPYNF